MSNLPFFLQRLISLPYQLVMGPINFFNENFNESGRSRALFLGMPAILIAVIGISAVCWTEFFNKQNLEQKYSAWAQDCSEDKLKLINKLNTERRLDERANEGGNGTFSISKDDERVTELLDLQNEEHIYLEKLISLNSGNADYRYRLALVSFQQGDEVRCRSLMESIASIDEPGDPEAHLWRARDLLRMPVTHQAQVKNNLRDALTHVDHCLVRDPGNLDAKLIRAQLLGADSRYKDAFKEYDDLFNDYPRFYKQLVQLNEKLGTTDGNSIIIENAQSKFREQIQVAKRDYAPNWSNCWTNLVECMHFRKDYAGAARLLEEAEVEENNLKQQAENSGVASAEVTARHVFIKQLLTRTYTVWADSLGVAGEIDIATETQQLELLKKALSHNLQHPDALKLVARIAAGDSALAEEARSLYDPEKYQGNAPASVLNEMGSRALNNKEYNKAIKYFEWAKEKSPNNPMILNNLAWTYLICENQKPDRALSLVNQAIRALQRITDVNERRSLASHFFDTRGRALLQMGRKVEASAAFEAALEVRSDNVEIIKSLILCYQGSDDAQVKVLEKRLQELEAASDETSDTIEDPAISNVGN